MLMQIEKFKLKGKLMCLIVIGVLVSIPPLFGQNLQIEDAAPPFGLLESFPEVHGVGNLQYYDFEQDGDDQGIPTFKASTFHLYIESHVRKNLRLITDVEWEEGKDFKSERIELRWELSKMAALNFGKFISPIGIEGRLHYASRRKMSSRPFMSRNIIPGTWPEVGVEIFGEVSISELKVNYDAFVSNGLKGPARNDRQTQDNNSDKMIGIRVGFVPVEGLETGGYYAVEKYDKDNLNEMNFKGTYLTYGYKGLQVVGEYIHSSVQDGRFDSTTKSTGTLNRSGFYIQAAYKILKNKKHLNYLEPVVRFDTLDPDESVSNNKDLYRYTIGMNVSPYPHFLIKTEYQWTREKKGPSTENDGFMLEFVLDF